VVARPAHRVSRTRRAREVILVKRARPAPSTISAARTPASQTAIAAEAPGVDEGPGPGLDGVDGEATVEATTPWAPPVPLISRRTVTAAGAAGSVTSHAGRNRLSGT